MDNTVVGLVRPLPRWAEATQRRSMAEAGVSRIVNLADERDEDVASRIRVRDTVHVYRLHLLANRKLPGIHTRSSMLWWLLALVERRVILVEGATERRVDTAQISDIPMLMRMHGEAVETITSGARGMAVARQIARENGSGGGRSRFDPTRNREAVEALHYKEPGDPGYVPDGPEFIRRLRRLKWSRSKAYDILGPRRGR